MLDLSFVALIPSGALSESAIGSDIIQMIIHAGPMVKFVLLVLFLFSFISWTIIFMKFRLLKRAASQTEDFLELFWENRDMKRIYKESERMKSSPVASLFRAGYAELGRIRKAQAGPGVAQSRPGTEGNMATKDSGRETMAVQRALMENLERSLRKATIDQHNKLEKALSFLATTGNTTPFIGLFGTVWGIMESFRNIGLKGSANLAVVAPGISEALIATAAGLAAAIPAVVAYNYFSQRAGSLNSEMDIFTTDFLTMVGRRAFVS
jgi:biopolymer transport protein TolQ